MLGAICSAVVGLTLVVLAGLGLYSLEQAPASRVPLIYASLMLGVLLLALGSLRLIYGSSRRRGHGGSDSGGGYFGPDVGVGGSSHGDCGHGGDSGGSGGDGGGGH
jgi:hypothetical protein